VSHPNIILIAHNIRSLWNVGSFFRTADAFKVEKLYLTGYTATPPRREIAKTALGADEWIPWEYQEDPLMLIEKLREEKWRIVSLELSEKSVRLTDYQAREKTCLIVGHEVLGVSQELLAASDDIVHIPMHGQKESLNVSVALGIALEHFRNG